MASVDFIKILVIAFPGKTTHIMPKKALDDTQKDLDCLCFSCWHHLHLVDWEDGTFGIDICNHRVGFWERLRGAFKWLVGDDYSITSILLDEEGLKELGEWIKKRNGKVYKE